MKLTQIERLPFALPSEIEEFCRGKRIFDSSSSPEARVFLLEGEEKFFLKFAKKGSLSREACLSEFFYRKGLGVEIISYLSEEKDILLSRAAVGCDCVDEKYLSDGKRLCDTTATLLRQLHETDFSGCPVNDRIGEYLRTAEDNYINDRYEKQHFPDSFGYSSGEEAWKVLREGQKLLKNECLIHGDYCLPNIILRDWRFSAFIDLGAGGIGDRHIDLFWGRWSLEFNLKTNAYAERFLDAYGRDKVDEDKLKVVAAAEVFG